MPGSSQRTLDQFYTPPEVAAHCVSTFRRVCAKHDIDLDAHHWIEPSAGAGAFLEHFPTDHTAIDIAPRAPSIMCANFLTWEISDKPVVVVGNPPFGHLGRTALAFINHAARRASAIGFILPKAFSARIRCTSPNRRVRGMVMVHSEGMDIDSFITPSGAVYRTSANFNVYLKTTPSNYALRIDEPYRTPPMVDAIVDIRYTSCTSRRHRLSPSADLYIRSEIFECRKNVFDYPYVATNKNNVRGWGRVYEIRMRGEHPECIEHLHRVPWSARGQRSSGFKAVNIYRRHIEDEIMSWLDSRGPESHTWRQARAAAVSQPIQGELAL